MSITLTDELPVVVERRNPGQTLGGRLEFRAYPKGASHPDGGVGPWVPDRHRAVRILEQAVLELHREAER